MAPFRGSEPIPPPILSTSPPLWLVWFRATRPTSLSASVVPVLVGTARAAAAGSYRPAVFCCALVSSLLIQIGTNFTNDRCDFQTGADSTISHGPRSVVQHGLLRPHQLACGAAISFGLATLVGLYLVYVGGWSILAIGILSIACGSLYTSGPWPLGYHGLGDLCTFLFFGVIGVTATSYLHTGLVDALALAISFPVGLLVTAILVANNLRDIDTDRAVGKHTLAVRLGAPVTRWQYALSLGLAFLVPPALACLGLAGATALLPLLTLPLAAPLARSVLCGVTGPGLNPVLEGTSLLHLLFGMLLALGLVLAG